MESNFTSLEVSKEMKELGLEQKSMFVWVVNSKFRNEYIPMLTKDIEDSNYSGEKYSAYLFTELLDMLPEKMPLFLLPASIMESLKKGQPTNIVSVQPPSVKVLTPDNLARLIIQLKKENKL